MRRRLPSSLAHGRAPVHGGLDRRVEPDELSAGLEPGEQIADVLRLCRGLQVERHSLDEPGDQLSRLLKRPVKEPGVPRPDPTDHLRRHTVVEQPDAGVHGRLPATDDRIPPRRLGQLDQTVDRDQPRVRFGIKRRRVGRRDRGLQIGRVDDLAPHPNRGRRTGQPGDQPAPGRLVQPVGHAEEPDVARRQQVLLEHPAVVIADLCRRRPLVETGVRAGVIDRVAAEDPRVDAIERRRLVQSHERVRVVPVAARAVSSVHHHDVDVRFGDQRINERHPRRTSTDDQVVGVDPCHSL